MEGHQKFQSSKITEIYENTIQTQAIIDRLIETKKMNPQSQKIVTFSRDFRCLSI